MVLSWLLVAWSACPWSDPGLKWLAGFALACSYALSAVVFGATDKSALEIVRAATEEMKSMNAAKQLDLVAYRGDVEAAITNANKAADRVSKAISELRQENGLR